VSPPLRCAGGKHEEFRNAHHVGKLYSNAKRADADTKATYEAMRVHDGLFASGSINHVSRLEATCDIEESAEAEHAREMCKVLDDKVPMKQLIFPRYASSIRSQAKALHEK
jgi:hypothetical protein